MLHTYVAEQNCLRRVETGAADPKSIVWFDLHNPSLDRSEEKFVEETLGIDVPTREEVNTLEISSRLYQEDGAVFMTETVLANSDHSDPQVIGITFILKAGRLVTLRYDEFPPLKVCADRALKPGNGIVSGEAVFRSVIESTLDRVGDVLSNVGAKVDQLSQQIFEAKTNRSFSNVTFKDVLLELGRQEHVVAAHPVQRAAHGIDHQAALHGLLHAGIHQGNARTQRDHVDAVKNSRFKLTLVSL